MAGVNGGIEAGGGLVVFESVFIETQKKMTNPLA
jgi:hypothetical protein